MRTNTPVPRKCPGFTLVELLVVIGVISILAGLLLPTLGEVMNSARRTQCLSQIKNTVTTFQIYADDFGGVLMMRMKSSSGTLWAKNLVNNGYIADWRVTTCNIQPARKSFNTYLTYGISYHFFGSKYEFVPSSGPGQGGDYLLLHRIQDPSKFVLLSDSILVNTDGNYPNGSWKVADVHDPGPGYGNIYFRHQGYANTTFADGHAATYDSPYDFRPFGVRKTVSYEGDRISLP